MAHRTGEDREQSALFPLRLEEVVAQEAVVRVIDAWVESLDLQRLGFAKARAAATGRPPYHPADLLKLYLYGYLNGVRSSRRLERECQRNVEVMWLLGRLAPDHKTVADFRRTQGGALVAASAAFVQFARRHGLVGGHTVAIDGSKVRAVASRKAVTGVRSLKEEAGLIEQRMRQFMQEMDEADAQEGQPCESHRAVRESLQALRHRQQEVEQQVQQLERANRTTLVLSEPEARKMKSLAGAPGYNLQTAVDAHSHLIVHHDVVNDVSDQQQLLPMALGAATALQCEQLEVLADAGYSSGQQLAELPAGIEAVLPTQRATNTHDPQGLLYGRADFLYDAGSDCYHCPAGQRLKRRSTSERDKIWIYAPDKGVCPRCPQQAGCTRSDRRWVSRSHFEHALQATAQRLQQRPDAMDRRRQTAEHPFGTIKDHILVNARLLMRGLAGAKAELSLAVMAYNLKRAINAKGGLWMLQASRA